MTTLLLLTVSLAIAGSSPVTAVQAMADSLADILSAPAGKRPDLTEKFARRFLDETGFAERATIDVRAQLSDENLRQVSEGLGRLIRARASRILVGLSSVPCAIRRIESIADDPPVVRVWCERQQSANAIEVVLNRKRTHIVDVQVDSVRLSKGYQGMFNKLMRTRGPTGLLAQLADRVRTEEAGVIDIVAKTPILTTSQPASKAIGR